MEKMEITELSELEGVADAVLLRLSEKKSEHASVLALYGDLGAGKTAFVKVLASKLGVEEDITSPTFVVMKKYDLDDAAKAGTFAHLVHIDAYRIDDIDEMRVLRFEEVLSQKETIICIEWAEKLEALLPQNTVHVRLQIKGEKRIITLS